MAELTEDVRSLLDGPNLAHFCTLMKDGSPQVTPVWVDHDGTHVLINTAEGRQKPRNLRRDPRVALTVTDREDTQRYALIRGRVTEMIDGEEAWEHITKLARKYSSDPNRTYTRNEGDVRIIIRIAPEHVFYRPGRNAERYPASRQAGR